MFIRNIVVEDDENEWTKPTKLRYRNYRYSERIPVVKSICTRISGLLGRGPSWSFPRIFVSDCGRCLQWFLARSSLCNKNRSMYFALIYTSTSYRVASSARRLERRLRPRTPMKMFTTGGDETSGEISMVGHGRKPRNPN